ncbi:hypothetical protein K2X30_05295 [bacterium]|nr:hypothetical protein [bacterium]
MKILLLLAIAISQKGWAADDIAVENVRRPGPPAQAPAPPPAAAPAPAAAPKPKPAAVTPAPAAAATSAPKKAAAPKKKPAAKKVTKKAAPTPAPAAEAKADAKDSGAVDLGAVDLNAMSGAEGKSSAQSSPHHFSGTAPNFKIYFDFNMISQPGTDMNFTFTNLHSFLFVESMPAKDILFTFDLSAAGMHYYELDYMANPRLTIRAGKIWIPFDDLGPHNLFGGRIGVSTINPAANALGNAGVFLPDLWTELGVGIRYKLIDKPQLSLTGDLYITNGIQKGTDALGNIGPNFSGPGGIFGATDNNRDKAFGARIQAQVARRISVGMSFYSTRYTNDEDPYLRLQILGFDTQVRLTGTGTELRAGLALMTVGTDVGTGQYGRSGYYGEVGQKFGKNQAWKGLLRAGSVNVDNRLVTVGDQTIIGGTLLYKPGLIQMSVEHSRDVKYMVAKTNREYTAFRVVMEF